VKQDHLYLIHISECVERIERYTVSGCAAFQEDTLIQDAVLRNLHTLTESVQRISDSFKAAHPEVAWREIAQFRNVVVHNYLGIDLARVWDIVRHDLPELARAVAAMLAELETE